MKRIDFIKRLFGMVIVPIAPAAVIANTVETIERYAHDDIFHTPYPNEHLMYFKPDSPVYKMIESALGDRIVESNRFRYYSPKHAFILLKKEFYTKEDFDPLIALLNGCYERHRVYAKYGYGETILRMICDKTNNSYYPDLFDADNKVVQLL